MANRVKEDERNERTIRNLLKLPENRRCINCNSLGPQYVCTNFWTFVCTTCSGIHREFTHRVKSVSMAKFTSQEVSALQGGGNASAKEIYFKEWDPQRHSFPDSSNVERLRDFIKHAYVDRRYTGERSFEKPPKGDSEDFSENRRIDSYQGGSRSPPYEDTAERRYSDRPSPGGINDDRSYRNDERSPGYGRSPARTEIVNDWRREDRFGNGRKSEDSRMSDGGSKFESRSPDRQRDLDASSPPLVRPVRDILGENVSPLRVIIEPPKSNGGRLGEVSTKTPRTTSSSSLASSNGNPADRRVESSLIDFDADPEPPAAAALPQAQPNGTSMHATQPHLSNSDNWANFESAPELNVSQSPANANSLESVLLELSFPGNDIASTSSIVSKSALPSENLLVAPRRDPSTAPASTILPAATPSSNSTGFFPAAATGHAPVLPFNDANSFMKVSDGGQWSNLRTHQNPLFPVTGGQPVAQSFPPAVDGATSGLSWNSMLAQNTQGPPTVSTAQAPQPTVGVTQPYLEIKSSGRKELPEDLFTSSMPTPLQRWQTHPPNGLGLPMPYNVALATHAFPQFSKSTNPFDSNSNPSLAQAPTFPSMAPLQNALPSMTPSTGLLRTSSLGTPSPSWMHQSSHLLPLPSQTPSYPIAIAPQAPSYPTAIPPQAPFFQSPMPPGSYMGQQVPSNIPARQPGLSFSPEGSAFGSSNPNPQLGGVYSAAAPANSFSSTGGNPFG